MSSTHFARPEFGKHKRTPDFYIRVRAYIESLRATTTMRDIAAMMNRMGWTTATGLPWTRQTVMNAVRKQSTN